MEANSLRILSLEIDAFKGVRAVSIPADGKPVVEIAGANGAGKSSVLDSVMATFNKGSLPDQPIRRGYSAARVKVDVGEFQIEMRVTGSGKQIAVRSKDGKTVAQPAAFLSAMVGKLWADPLQFINMEPREQVKTLQRLTGLDERFEEIDRRKRDALERIREVEGRMKSLDTQIAAFPVLPAGPEVETSAAEMLARLNAARAARDEARDVSDWITRREAKVNALTQQIEALQKELAQVRGELDGEKGRAAREIAANVPDVAALEREFTELSARNEEARNRAARKRLWAERQAAEKDRLEWSRAAEAADADRRTSIERATLPVDGLAFTDDGLLLDGIPFAQVNTAKQLEVGVAMALATNPRLRVVLIRNGSLLDSNGFKRLHELMDKYDAQAIVERTTDGTAHEGGFVIHEGELVAGGGK